jgi:IclR family pca regulon transcriptional regulator
MGKAILAFLPDEERDRVLAESELLRRGPNTLTNLAALRKDLARVRERGLAINDEELAYGLRSIAAPVRSPGRGAAAAINIAVHRSMVSIEDLLERLGPSLEATAAQISSRVGPR